MCALRILEIIVVDFDVVDDGRVVVSTLPVFITSGFLKHILMQILYIRVK